MRKVLVFTLIVLMLTGFANAELLNVFVPNQDGTINFFNATDAYSLTSWSAYPSFSTGTAVHPPTLNVFSIAQSANQVSLFNYSNGYTEQVYTAGATSINAIAIDGNGDVWYTERTSGGSLWQLKASTDFTVVEHTTAGTFPSGVAVDKNNNVIISLSNTDLIEVFNASDSYSSATYSVGNLPLGVATDDDNNIWVANYLDNTVSMMDASNGYAETTYATGNTPWGVLIDNNNDVIIANPGQTYLTKLDSDDGYSSSTISTAPRNVNQVSVDSDNNLLGVDPGDDILVFLDYSSAYAATEYTTSNNPSTFGSDFTGQIWQNKFGGAADTPPVVSNAQLIASDDPINSSNANLISSWDYSDAENESMIANQTIWYKDSVEQPSLENQSIISNTNTAVGESWQFKARAQASNLVWSTYEFSNSLVILNNAPVMSALEIGPVPLYASVNATAEAIYTDSEGDVGTVNFEWFINNVSSYSENVTSVSSGSKAESQLNFGLYNEGDVIYFKTYGTDGLNQSAIETSSSLTVQATPVVATDGEVFNYLALLMAVLILVLSIAICCIEDNFVKMMLLIPLNLIVLTAVHIGKLIVEEAYSSLTAVATVLDALFICLAVMIIPLTVILFCYVVYKIIDSVFNSRKKRDNDWDKWQD